MTDLEQAKQTYEEIRKIVDSHPRKNYIDHLAAGILAIVNSNGHEGRMALGLVGAGMEYTIEKELEEYREGK